MRFLNPLSKTKVAKQTSRKSATRRASAKLANAKRGKGTTLTRRTVGRSTAPRKSSNRKPVRRRTPLVLKPRVMTRLAAGVAVASLVCGSVWLWQSGWVGHQTAKAVKVAYGLSANLGLKLADLQVAGRQRTETETILSTMAVKRDMPLLMFDPEQARQALEALPWVRQAEVERHFPDVVFVRLHEREPLALWQMDGDVHLIDRHGDVISEASAHNFAHLPLVVGPGAQYQAAQLIDLLGSEPDLKKRVSGAVWISDRRWNLQMDGRIEVRLPEGDLTAAWQQLAEVEREHGVFERDVKIIDMRIPDRLVVRTSPDAKPLSHPSDEEEST